MDSCGVPDSWNDIHGLRASLQLTSTCGAFCLSTNDV